MYKLHVVEEVPGNCCIVFFFSFLPLQQSPRLPKSVSRFSRISIKRVSGVFSSSVLSGSNSSGEANSVFYTSSGMLLILICVASMYFFLIFI